jgi:hypothetical protein
MRACCTSAQLWFAPQTAPLAKRGSKATARGAKCPPSEMPVMPMRAGSTSGRLSSQSTARLAQLSERGSTGKACNRSASPLPGWSTHNVEMPRRASCLGRRDHHSSSLQLSRPLQ